MIAAAIALLLASGQCQQSAWTYEGGQRLRVLTCTFLSAPSETPPAEAPPKPEEREG